MLSGCNSESEIILPPARENTATISVEKGLSTSFADDAVYLKIPANAIDSDTAISLSVLEKANAPDPEHTTTELYLLEPEQLTLKQSSELRLLIPSEIPANHSVFIARLENGVWVNNPTSVHSANQVSAKISGFGIYSARIVASPMIPVKTIGPECNSRQTAQSVRFIHVADLHSRFGYKEKYFSKIKAAYHQARLQQPYTVFTNGGDDYEKGTVAEQLSQGQATLEAIKAMEFDVRVIGNHDYAWGPEQLLDYTRDDNAIVIASNTQYVGDDQQGFAAVDFGIVEAGCMKIGFFGMTSVPWNELDQPMESPPIPDFIPGFKMNWEWEQVASNIVGQYRDQVDYMVMLSHLGVSGDRHIAANVEGIDLVLGGHTHGGVHYEELSNGAIVIQPDFFARGFTDIELEFDVRQKTLVNHSYNARKTGEVLTPDPITEERIDQIMGKYAPDAATEFAISENYPSTEELATISAKAAEYIHNTELALLDPKQVQTIWTPGGLTQETLHKAYYVERQPSNTPGFNALYQVEVTGKDYKAMRQRQPLWVAYPAIEIDEQKTYRVALQKGPALNPELFFSDIKFQAVTPLSETWWALDKYARERTRNCLHIDSDKPLNVETCDFNAAITIWNFDKTEFPLAAESGPSTLTYYDPDNTQWGNANSRYQNTESLGLPALPDGHSNVMAFSNHTPRQGLQLTHNVEANGDFVDKNWVSDYTLVMDVLWPEGSDGQYRALWQTDTSNTSDADIFVDPAGGVGIATSGSGYYGELLPDTWYRIGLVFYSAPEGGVFKIYINGKLVGEKNEGDINERWALKEFGLLLTDDSGETAPGYLNALLFAGHPFTATEMAAMGGPSKKMTFSPPIKTLNQVVERHYKSAPPVSLNPWQAQRAKFFGQQQE